MDKSTQHPFTSEDASQLLERDWGNQRDRHHVWWQRDQYLTRLERRFRTQRGFIIPMPILAHRELHSQVGKPPKPNRYQMSAVLDQVGPYDITPVHSTIELFQEWSSREGKLAENAADIAKHLTRQTDYLWVSDGTQ